MVLGFYAVYLRMVMKPKSMQLLMAMKNCIARIVCGEIRGYVLKRHDPEAA